MEPSRRPVFFCLAGEKLGVVKTAEDQTLSALRKVVQTELLPAVKLAFPTGWLFTLGGAPVQKKQEKDYELSDVIHQASRCITLTSDRTPFSTVAAPSSEPVAAEPEAAPTADVADVTGAKRKSKEEKEEATRANQEESTMQRRPNEVRCKRRRRRNVWRSSRKRRRPPPRRQRRLQH
eukprot:471234-Prymnesium_polylepis.1